MPDPTTLLDALEAALRAATAHDPDTQSAPACVVWTDEKSEWAPALARLHRPYVLTLGDYDPETRSGPAVWIRAALGGTLPGIDLPDGVVPVVYLPGVSRSALRAVASLPRALQPLAELQYRGVLFSQASGRDWTALAFLASPDGGLNLDVARDAATAEALARALPELVLRPVADLRGRRLEAADFNALLAPDPARDLLRWIGDPDAFRASCAPGAWAAFRDVLRQTYGVDPDADGPLGGAVRLGARSGPWAAVWERFAEAPARYPGVPERLAQARPPTTGDLFAPGAVRETWPQDNTAEEELLRAALLSLGNATPARAAAQVRSLDERHGVRRQWVWADLGEAPLAVALEPLARLAEAAAQPVAGPTPEACADAYRAGGWHADDAFLCALAAVASGPDGTAVRTAAVALYRPWLEATAQAFQAALGGNLPPQPPVAAETPEPGVVWFFVDALRLDVGHRLAEALRDAGAIVEETTSWSAFPSITATAKPACSPVADGVRGGAAMHEFAPETLDGKPLTTHRFRALVASRGIDVLGPAETGDPSRSAWTETGAIDTKGHDDGWTLACRLDELVADVADRVQGLLGAGWREVRVVTDHGWLLLPGGLPKSDLPKALATARWARSAELVPGSQTELPTHGWFWNPDVRVAVAPTIHAFALGVEYAHGGLTLQECLVPRLVVTGSAATEASARMTSAEWVNLRCRVAVGGEASGTTVDLRLRPADAASSVALAPKPVVDGAASLVVPDDTLEGAAAVVVLLSASGTVVHQLSTVIGG